MKKFLLKKDGKSTYIILSFIIIAFIIMIFFAYEDVFNIIFLGLMGLILALAYRFGILKMHEKAMAVGRVKEKVNEFINSSSESAWNYVCTLAPLFDNEDLDHWFTQYKREMNRLGNRGGEVHCDIGDYINEEIINESCSKGVLSQISGMMTGLGILGTFLGLTIGLKDFDASTAEAMAGSISPLMDGIKVAFYTSIFGVIFSLLFNYALGNEEKLVDNKVDEFLTFFYENVISDPGNDMAKKIVTYQQESTQAIKELAESISVKITESFKNATTPALEAMNDTLKDLSVRMVDRQNQGISDAAEKFVEAMNQSVNNEFDNLSNTIKSTCTWQKEMMSDMQGVLDEIRKSGENITNINMKFEQMMNMSESYFNKLEAFQTGVNSAYEVVAQEKEMFEQSIMLQRTMMEEMQSSSDSISNSLKNSSDDIARIATQTITQVNEAEEIASRASILLKQNADALTSASGAFNDDVQKTITRTFELFDENLSDITLRLSGTVSEINDLTSELPKTLYGYADELKSGVKKYIDSVADTQKELEKVAKQLRQ